MNMMSKFSLQGKNVVITGAIGILGKTFCAGLAEAGANIALIDRNMSELEHFCKELQEQYGIRANGYVCDISQEARVERVVEQVVKDFGVIHVLHNNAASKSSSLEGFFEKFEDYSHDIWKEIMAVNVDGMFLMAKYVGRHMLRCHIRGSIVQTASIYGVVAPDQRIYEGSNYMGRKISSPAVYSVSKAAVVGLTSYLAAYWGEHGIRVNTITPGGVSSGQNGIFQQKYSARVPLGRMGESQELVGALIYLASDASSYVTGQNIIVDGGLSVW